ncbi:hypothetical protein [Niabella ginsengisoli]|uniref:Uncharacterized protein n=1 Tax=Niabella ginsengisoli TaxID=522298 RepID=A0ABS9SNR0_9BACT|nr:hypothetical protein [Niabella ginsengisoli]MCH5600028.1 hypothetical protein [Niabella ginsengisoli]
MPLQEIFDQFINGIKATTLPEYIAVLAGIASVWYSKKSISGYIQQV